ncbi:MAG: hypothetical protein UV58_C0005G0031 [Candidatus Wolfebacteria bacterium GW2011_GWC1_43_10]|uniref:Translation elongation factor-like protein n=2 Tax=Candidatus Wolfeibacteriota TaxID=1752735 RepID=A0A0G1CB56_9BACT|nr:MAG: hypothetical protein UV58_C0005G0031 [Candidatus Wolfebacteria bacterium GW2011_GWC1_43_10]KKT23164.1 MAG: hypothetical protein UW08_C0001G0127 [Parcubacteria group bacterium GW2011_GWB1_43_8b]OGM89279.1 MAG: hypothetical protein A2108_00180 [Candidatus Wolfebacteria bacterium GWA1_42_9]
MAQKPIAKVIHLYGKIGVAILECLASIEVGQMVHFKGHTTDFQQEIKSMQYEHEAITKAKKGQQVGVKVDQDVREGDEVYPIEE